MDSNILHKEIFVNASQEHSFKVFTEQFDSWWPRGHHIGTAELDKVIIEPKSGGRWYERGTDGSETLWGKVVAYDPYDRVLLTWQLTHQWTYDPDFETEVEVTFVSKDGGTLVTLEHRNLDRYGEHAVSQKTALDNTNGWGGLMRLFADRAETVEAHS